MKHLDNGSDQLSFLFLEPFYGGSHRDFLLGLIEHSSHSIDSLKLPARFWKWRMRGSAIYFVNEIDSLEGYDGLIVTDMLSLAEFKSMVPSPCPPALVYFHENQLTYPLAYGESFDVHFGMTNTTSALAADRVLFNSHTHMEAFFERLPGFIGQMPDFEPRWAVETIREKSGVLYPGCRYPEEEAPLGCGALRGGEIPVIIWNHRWEHDKSPETFFSALDRVADEEVDFKLALMGESFTEIPECFSEARSRYGDRILQYGIVESRSEYIDWLKRGTVVVSTAKQENFGISMAEAVRFGCLPLVPNRLSYPEILPRRHHPQLLYSDTEGLVKKLMEVLADPNRFLKLREELSVEMARFSWERVVGDYDTELEHLAGLNT